MLGNSKYVIIITFPRQQLISERVTIQVLITILVILEVSGALDAAWWQSVLMTIKILNTRQIYTNLQNVSSVKVLQ